MMNVLVDTKSFSARWWVNASACSVVQYVTETTVAILDELSSGWRSFSEAFG